MNVTVDIFDETARINEEHEQFIRSLLTTAFEKEALEGEIELSITFVDDARIQELNRSYRNKDQATDVISFALNDEVEEEQNLVLEELPNALGDIIISVPRIELQAKEYGHSFDRELGFLVVHGVLHLLGYDHQTKEEEQAMFKRQEDILTAYGLTR